MIVRGESLTQEEDARWEVVVGGMELIKEWDVLLLLVHVY